MFAKIFRKLKKNKTIVLAICVIILCVIYFFAQKAIDNFVFNNDENVESVDNVISDVNRSGDKKNEAGIEENIGSEAEGEGENDAENEAGSEGSIKNESSNDGSGTDFGTNSNNSENTSNGNFIQESEIITEESVQNQENVVQTQNVNQNKIYVYITGEVNVPGVVILNKGSRIVDAINAAGGTTDKADISKVNLVYVLEDGMKVNIPNKTDLKNNPNFEYITQNSGDGSNDKNIGSGSSSSSSSGSNSSESNSSSGSNSPSGSSTQKYNYIVNINTATQTELETLPGIGPSIALKIINYRKENGKFSSIDDIKNVNGIGDAKFGKIKEYIKI